MGISKCVMCLQVGYNNLSCKSIVLRKSVSQIIAEFMGELYPLLDDLIFCEPCVVAMIRANSMRNKCRTLVEQIKERNRKKAARNTKKEPNLEQNETDHSTLIDDCEHSEDQALSDSILNVLSTTTFKREALNELEMQNNITPNEKMVQKQKPKKKVVEKNIKKSSKDSLEPYTFECMKCKYTSDNEEEFKAHLKVMHNMTKMRLYKCQECRRSFGAYRNLNVHLGKLHKKPPLGSSPMDNVTTTTDVKEEIVKKKEEPSSIELPVYINCEICGKSKELSKMSTHMEKHGADALLICKNCGTIFDIKEKFLAHTETMKCNNWNYICTNGICHRRYKTSSKLLRHVQKFHMDEPDVDMEEP